MVKHPFTSFSCLAYKPYNGKCTCMYTVGISPKCLIPIPQCLTKCSSVPKCLMLYINVSYSVSIKISVQVGATSEWSSWVLSVPCWNRVQLFSSPPSKFALISSTGRTQPDHSDVAPTYMGVSVCLLQYICTKCSDPSSTCISNSKFQRLVLEWICSYPIVAIVLV